MYTIIHTHESYESIPPVDHQSTAIQEIHYLCSTVSIKSLERLPSDFWRGGEWWRQWLQSQINKINEKSPHAEKTELWSGNQCIPMTLCLRPQSLNHWQQVHANNLDFSKLLDQTFEQLVWFIIGFALREGIEEFLAKEGSQNPGIFLFASFQICGHRSYDRERCWKWKESHHQSAHVFEFLHHAVLICSCHAGTMEFTLRLGGVDDMYLRDANRGR